MKKISTVVLCIGAVLFGAVDCASAAAKSSKTSKQSAISKGTSVRTRVEAKGVYDQECYDAYYGCMDQFCITDNSNGGSCACSDKNAEYEKRFAAVTEMMEEAERIRTVEVERVQAGADADIVFTGERRYGSDGEVLAVGEVDDKEKEQADLMALWDSNVEEDEDEEDIWGSGGTDFSELFGADLYTEAHKLCAQQAPEKCEKDIAFLHQVYSRQITSDCKGFENSLKTKEAEAKLAIASAEGEVRKALKESLEEANEYDRGTCMVEYKKCMQTEDACGKNWENCVSVIASENMQNNTAKSTAGTTVETVQKYDISASTMEILESKRYICEKVLDKCIAVRDMVWPDFLREAAPTIKVAESKVESQFRQSCLTNISNCIQTACKDDIVGKGVATMDACLSRPDMARSFCKVEIDPCERMEPLIWGYVTDKLAAMRVDVCTQEVKDCFTADTRCGPNFENCIGMDYEYIHDICPIDSLVVCKANNPNFSMDDLDSMLMGLYLNIDNSALDQCQNLIDEKMAELCGSTTDCNKFAADEVIGTGSLRSQKKGTIYRVTGMISFGSIKMGDSGRTVRDDGRILEPGEIAVQEYMAQVRDRNKDLADEGILDSIEEELNNIAGTINRTIEMIEQDPEIQFCVSGRDLSQITGKKGAHTEARFPNLLNQTRIQIAVAALKKAQENYNKKLTAEIAEATKNASIDVAQYMCQKVAANGGGGVGDEKIAGNSSDLATPFAVSYDVGSGLSVEDLTKGGAGVLKAGGATFTNNGYLGGGNLQNGGVTKTVRAVFSRETRTCRICSQTTTESCKTTGSKSWFHNSKNTSCETKASEETCDDIVM